MDQKVCEAKKYLNEAISQTQKREKRLEDLNTQLKQMMQDASDAELMTAGTSDDAMVSKKTKIDYFPEMTCF